MGEVRSGLTRAVNLRREAYDVYIGRAGRGSDGTFGNPCALGRPCPECGSVHMDGGSTLACYKGYLERRLASDPAFRSAMLELRGKRLGCFCKPAPCHGDVLAQWLDAQEEAGSTQPQTP
jgi:hypothetical protein